MGNGYLSMTKSYRLGIISLKHQGSFAIKESPVELEMPLENYMIDRWGPVSDTDKDMISQFPEIREEWVKTSTDIWFGFEGEGMVFPNHIFEYYNLIVLRSILIDSFSAVDIVAVKLGCEK